MMQNNTIDAVFNDLIATRYLSENGYKILSREVTGIANKMLSGEGSRYSEDDKEEIIASCICSICQTLLNKGKDEKIENPRGYIYRSLENEKNNSRLNYNNRDFVRFHNVVSGIFTDLEKDGECFSYKETIVDKTENRIKTPVRENEINDFVHSQNIEGIVPEEDGNWTQVRKNRLREIVTGLLSIGRPLEKRILLESLAARLGIIEYKIIDLYMWTDDGMEVRNDKDDSALSPEESLLYNQFFEKVKFESVEFFRGKKKDELDTLVLFYCANKNLREIAEHIDCAGTSSVDYYVNKPKNRSFFQRMGRQLMGLEIRPEVFDNLKKKFVSDFSDLLYSMNADIEI